MARSLTEDWAALEFTVTPCDGLAARVFEQGSLLSVGYEDRLKRSQWSYALSRGLVLPCGFGCVDFAPNMALRLVEIYSPITARPIALPTRCKAGLPVLSGVIGAENAGSELARLRRFRCKEARAVANADRSRFCIRMLAGEPDDWVVAAPGLYFGLSGHRLVMIVARSRGIRKRAAE